MNEFVIEAEVNGLRHKMTVIRSFEVEVYGLWQETMVMRYSEVEVPRLRQEIMLMWKFWGYMYTVHSLAIHQHKIANYNK